MSKATETAAWSDLEQAFFEAAPPDEAEPLAEPAFFADLVEVRPPVAVLLRGQPSRSSSGPSRC